MKSGLLQIFTLILAQSVLVGQAVAHEGTKKEDPTQGDYNSHVHVDVDKAKVYKQKYMHSIFLLTAEQSEGRFSIVKEIFLPGFNSYPMAHSHNWHSEVFYFTSGRMQWTVNDETMIMEAGDFLYIPPRAPHAAVVLGDEPVHAVMVYEPGGYEKNYFKRTSLTDEQRKDRELVGQMMKDSDVNRTKMEQPKVTE